MAVWLPRIVTEISGATRPVAMLGGEPFGTPFVVDALRDDTRLAWLELGRSASEDPVAIGNALARAVNTVLEGPLLPIALPYRAHLNALRRHRADVLPLRLAVTVGAPEQSFLEDLLDLHSDGFRVLLDVRGAAVEMVDVLERCHVLGPETLRLSLGEAQAAVPGALSTAEVEALWRSTEGRFTELSDRGQRAARLPKLLVPSAGGSLRLERDAALVEPRLAVLALQREGNLVAALELAVLHAPELVEGLIRAAGPRFQEEGLLARLHLTLSALPEPYSSNESVLEWRFVAGFAAGDHAEVLNDVDAYLETHAAPALRARRAGSLPPAPGFAMAEQAVKAKRTPLTLWQFGRLHPQHETAVVILRESVAMAEDSGTRYEVARNADTLAARLFHMGQFGGAASWGRWAIDVFDEGQLQDSARRLLLLNNLAGARIMTGDLIGLRPSLEEAQVLVEGSVPRLATLLRGTLAQLELAEGNPEAALELISATYHGSPRLTRARYGSQLVRVLSELGRNDAALTVAADVTEITAADESAEQSMAALARGMVRAVVGAPGAESDLMAAMIDTELVAQQRLTAALYYLLASGGAAHNIPGDLAPVLRDIHPTALRVLSGPESVFAAVWATLTGSEPVLSFQFLGTVACRYESRELPLSPRLAEVAVALSLQPEGMTRDELNTFLTPDGQAPFSSGGLRGMMTRLRTMLPVSDAPYRFTVPFRTDFLEVRDHLAAGRIREAVTLLRGSLLPFSEAPGVEEQRWALEEELRQVALMSSDPDALFDLAERLGDDLEFWEATADSLSAGDPRLALARARVRRLEVAYGLKS